MHFCKSRLLSFTEFPKMKDLIIKYMVYKLNYNDQLIIIPLSPTEPICRKNTSNKLFHLPSTIGMLDDNTRCKNTPLNISNFNYLPISHCVANNNFITSSDDEDVFFYYYASGCSNIYIKLYTEKTLEGINRIDVHSKLLEKELGPNFIEKIKLTRSCELTKENALRIRRTLNPCNQKVRKNSCVSQIDIQTEKKLGRRLLATKFGFDTLIYQYEGSDSNILTRGRWKTEIQRILPYTIDNFWTNKNNMYERIVVKQPGPLQKCLFENSSWIDM